MVDATLTSRALLSFSKKLYSIKAQVSFGFLVSLFLLTNHCQNYNDPPAKLNKCTFFFQNPYFTFYKV